MFKTLGLYIVGPAAILGMLAVSQSASTSRPAEVKKNVKAELRGTTKGSANIACVAAAVNTREAALGSGIAAYTVGVQSAYSARAVALQAAYVGTDTAQIRSAVKTAWTTFRASTKAASKAWKTAQRSAWAGFATAVKACKASDVPTDSANSTSETRGE